jgi:geranyl-CoA carboxylase alpha subunit
MNTSKSIHRILIANRGEIARRIIRSAHRLGIETVAVYSDTDANSLPVREATQSVALQGVTAGETYLNIDKIMAAALASGADAIHPGYGFLSENAEFAQAVCDAGLSWIGPPPAAIRAVGSKAGAKHLAQQVGAPCLPGYFGADQSDAALMAAAEQIGYPLMVKASHGGGGRGMRLVLGEPIDRRESELRQALAAARSEALAAFGSADLVLERALLSPRHVEVQIFADAQGHCVHMGERDCSVQRRHQKIIEESPSPGLSDVVRARMTSAAVALAQAAGYVGAGTVEFLLEGSGDTAAFYLMEMNTRLQVEHCVTEMRTGLDLVEWQIRVARGESLPLSQAQIQLKGHAIEVRLCAEDEHFMPQMGRVLHFKAPASSTQLRFDHALEQGVEVSPHFDAMVGKLIAHADDRGEAISLLKRGLQHTEILGLASNRMFLMACLDHPHFASGLATVGFLNQCGDQIRASVLAQRANLLPDWGAEVIMNAALGKKFKPSTANKPLAPQTLICPFPRPMRWLQNGEVYNRAWDAKLQHSIPAVQCGQAHFHAQHQGIDWWVSDASFDPPEQSLDLTAASTDIRAPFNGKLIAVNVKAGQTVRAGDTLFVIESMKLEHAVQAAHQGQVAEVLVSLGQQVSPKQLMAQWLKEAAA